MLHQFIFRVPHISADHLVHCLPYFPLPFVTPNIKSFFIESVLCILCPKYFNFLMVAEVSRECLGIIWLVTDAFILLPVHGIIILSFIWSPLHPYSTTGKTLVYISLTFVFVVESSKSFMIFVKFPIACLLKLIIFLVSSLVKLSLVMRTTKNL